MQHGINTMFTGGKFKIPQIKNLKISILNQQKFSFILIYWFIAMDYGSPEGRIG